MNQVVMMVNALPHDEFNESPTVHKEQSGSRMKDLSAAEKAKPNKYAKALIMSDNRKAAAIGDYVKTILKKDIVPPPNPMPEDNNCVFRAFLQQMPNHDYFFNQETGEVYSANDLRNQMVAFCVYQCSSHVGWICSLRHGSCCSLTLNKNLIQLQFWH